MKIKFKFLYSLVISGFLFMSLVSAGREQPEKMSLKPKKIILKFGHDMPENSPQDIAARKFAAIVAERTQNQVKIEVFPNQTIGSDYEMIYMLQSGELDIGMPPSAKLSTIVPELQILDLPFIFNNKQAVHMALDGKIGQMLLGKMTKHDFIGVTIWESGFKQMTSNKEIKTVEDFKDQKFRMMKSEVIEKQFQELGAIGIPIDFHKTYSALKEKVVDGQENPLGSIVSMNFQEVQDHILLTNHAYLSQIIVFSKKSYDRLSLPLRNILYNTAVEMTRFQRKLIYKRERDHIELLKSQNKNVYSLNQAEALKLQKKLRPLSDSYVDKLFPELAEEINLINTTYGNNDGAYIKIGVDADMSLGGAQAGTAITRGAQLAINQINQEGGLLGKRVMLDVKDHAGIASRGKENIAEFAANDNMLAVIGGLHSPVALAELELIHENKIIYLNPWAAATKIVDNGFDPNYVFRFSVRDEYAGGFLVGEAVKKSKKIALLLENTGWGRSNEKAMKAALQKYELTPVTVAWFNWVEKGMVEQLNQIIDSGAEIVLLVGNAPEGVEIIRLFASNQKAQNIEIMSHWGITGGYFWENTREYLKKIRFSFLQTFSFFDNSKPALKELENLYLAEYGGSSTKDIFAPVGTIHAYELVMLLKQAVTQAGTFEAEQVHTALENITNYEGVTGLYEKPFSKENHDALNIEHFQLATFGSRGEIIPVKQTTTDE